MAKLLSNQLQMIAYASQSCLGLDPRFDEAHPLDDAFIRSCQANNLRDGITGFLYDGNGLFFQYIEGNSTELNALYDRIQADPRHHNIITIANKPIDDRFYRDWSLSLITERYYLITLIEQMVMYKVLDVSNELKRAKMLTTLLKIS